MSCVDWSLTGLINRILTVNDSAIVNAKPEQQIHTSLIIVHNTMHSKEETLTGKISPKVVSCYTYNYVM